MILKLIMCMLCYAVQILSRAQESFVYRKAKENLYPVVAPYADPALEKVASSTYYKAALEHITPASA